MKINFPDGFSVDDTFNLSRLYEEGRLEVEPVRDKNGQVIYINVRKKPRPTLKKLRELVEHE